MMTQNVANELAVYKVLKQEFGITADLFNTGGGCMAYEAALDNGDFLCITEGDDFINPYRWRINGYFNRTTGELIYAGESAGNPWGWTALVYLPDPDDPNYRAEQPYAGAINHAAFFCDLDTVVAQALRAAAGSQRTGTETYIHTNKIGDTTVSKTLWLTERNNQQ